MIKDYQFSIARSHSQRKPIKVETNLDKERIKRDYELSKDLIQALNLEKKIEIDNLFTEDFEKKPLLYKLDLCLLFLRKAHSYCFYCASVIWNFFISKLEKEFHDERMLAAKCGPIHLRQQIDSVENYCKTCSPFEGRCYQDSRLA